MDEYIKPDYKNIALITIDVQNDSALPGSPLEIKGTMDIIPNTVKLLALFREHLKLVIHIIRLYKEDGSNVDLVRRKRIESGISAVRPGSDGAELVNELKPKSFKINSERLLKGFSQELTSNEFIIYKPRWGAFYSTPLEEILRAKKITTLAFTGCNFPNCPRTSIYEASERDFRIVIIQDAISGIYDRGLEELRNIGCEVILTDDFIRSLNIN